jgi:V8-like Glu-specific endopeptidase
MIAHMRAILVALILAAGCTQAPAPTGRTAEPIVNGDLDTGDDAVVAVVAFGHAFCSGTLVSQRLVVTAAHCIDPAMTGGLKFSDMSIFFGSDLASGGTTVQVQTGLMHPMWNPSTFANDIALLLLTSPAPFDPVAMNTTHFDDTFINRRVRIAGFGVTAATSMSTGTKRQAMTTLTEYTPLDFKYSTDPGQTCFGDSGGPGFLTIGGKEVLAGVTSNGDPSCTVYGNDTRVDQYLSFIGDYLAANVGCGADGQCTFGCLPADPDCGAIGCMNCGTTATGDFCQTNADCLSGLCIDAPDDPTIKYCSQPCTAASFCPAPLYGTKPLQCEPTNQGDLKVCTYQVPTPTGVGWECKTADDCHSKLCIAPPGVIGTKVCTRTCLADGDSDCPLSYTCEAPPGGPDAGIDAKWVCVPELRDTSTGVLGCAIRVGPGAVAAPSGVLLGLALLIARRRKRSR